MVKLKRRKLPPRSGHPWVRPLTKHSSSLSKTLDDIKTYHDGLYTVSRNVFLVALVLSRRKGEMKPCYNSMDAPRFHRMTLRLTYIFLLSKGFTARDVSSDTSAASATPAPTPPSSRSRVFPLRRTRNSTWARSVLRYVQLPDHLKNL